MREDALKNGITDAEHLIRTQGSNVTVDSVTTGTCANIASFQPSSKVTLLFSRKIRVSRFVWLVGLAEVRSFKRVSRPSDVAAIVHRKYLDCW